MEEQLNLWVHIFYIKGPKSLLKKLEMIKKE